MQFSCFCLTNLLSTQRWLSGMGVLLIGASSLYAQDSWQGSSGSWFTGSNWSMGVPTSSDVAMVDNGTTVQIVDGEAFANTLIVGGTHPGSTVVLGAGGYLDINNPLQIQAGGLFVFAGGVVSNADVVDNGTLEIAGQYQIQNLNVSGTGGLIINQTNTLVETGILTNSGPTQILGGTFQAGAVGVFSANSAYTVNSTLDLNGFNNAIGSLSGTGTVVNSGSTNATLTVGQDNTSTLFSGVLADGPEATLALTKVGTGTLILTGINTYTGQTTIDAGALVVDGSIASTETVVNAGALVVDGTIASTETVINAGGTLGGTGLINGNVVNNGIVSPGDPIGTLRISGNYVQSASGTLRIGVSGTAAGQYGVLAVSGHATLGGTLQIVPVDGFQLAVGNKLTFLTATGGVSGNFSTTQNLVPSSTAVEAEFVLLPDAVEIEGTQGSYVTILQSIPGVTPNELAVAKALDSAAGDPREAALFAYLNSQPIANLPHDLSLIAPTQISSLNATVSLGKVQMSNIGQRMGNIHAGSTGFSSSGFGFNGDATIDSGLAGESGPDGKSGPSVLAPVPENRWGVFVTGLGEFTNVDSTPNANGYDVNTAGITLGVDYRVTPYFAAGLMGGYAHTDISLVGGGNIDVSGGTFGAYATVFGNGFYLDTAVTAGPNGYDTHRTALLGNANGSTEGADVNVVVSGGYDWKYGNFSVGPTANFQFGYVGLDGFSETGSLAPLKFPDQNSESETTAFGARAMYEWKIGKVAVIPQVSAAWQHEYGSVAYQVVAGFASGAGASFTVNGPDIGRDSLLIGAGVSIILSDRISTYVFYDGDVARTNYDSHTVTGGFRITF